MGFLESQAFSNCSVSFSVSCRGAQSFWRDTHVFRPCDGVADSRRLCWRPFRDCRAAGEPSVLLIRCHLPTHPSQGHILILWSLGKLPSAGLAPHKWEMLGNGRTVHGPQQRSPDVWSLSWGWGRGQGAWRGYGHGDLFRSPAEKDAPRGQSPRAVPPESNYWLFHTKSLGSSACWLFLVPLHPSQVSHTPSPASVQL